MSLIGPYMQTRSSRGSVPLVWSLCVLVASIGSAHFGVAWADSPLEVIDTEPSAVIGDVLAIPVRVKEERLESELPEQVELLFDDGRYRGALVTWIGPPSPEELAPITPSWTAPTMPIRALAVLPEGTVRLSRTGVLLCPLPSGYTGRVRFDETVIVPSWIAAPLPFDGDALEPKTGPGWPVLDDPGSWWRWALLAEHSGRRPPELRGDIRSQLLARHIAGLWRAGLARLRSESPGTASELLDLLVARCTTERGDVIAAWITDPTELRSILELMLDMRRENLMVVRSVLFFLDARFPVVAWTTMETGVRVRVALANPTDGEQVVRVQWIEGDPVPSAAIIPPRRVIEIDVDRPREPVVAPSIARGRPKPNELAFFIDRHQHRLKLRADRVEARPPGAQLGPFLSPMTLTGAWSGVSRISPRMWETNATLRKRDGAWELFLDCFFDGQVRRMRDEVEIFLGSHGAPVRVIRLSSDGSMDFQPGSGRLRGAEATTRTHADRWRAVVRFDPKLVQSAGLAGRPGIAQIGLRRLLDGRPISSAGGAVPPWDAVPPTFLVDLTTWGDIQPSGASGVLTDEALLYSTP